MDITWITEENQRYFAPLMPDEFWKRADLLLGAVEDGTACAMIAAREEGIALKILNLFVAEPFRGRGIGRALLERFHRIARETGFDLAVCELETGEDGQDEELAEFLEENLFVPEESEDPVYEVSFGDLAWQYFGAEPKDTGKKTAPLSRVTSRCWKRFAAAVYEQAGDEEDAIRLLSQESYDPEVSFLLMEEETPAGGILFEKREDGYALSCICLFGEPSPQDMMTLFRAAFEAMEPYADAQTPVYVCALNETSQKLVQRLSGNKAVRVGETQSWIYTY